MFASSTSTSTIVSIEDIPNALGRPVNVSMKFERIGEIDSIREHFYAEVVLKLDWRLDMKIKRYDKKKHWNPMVYIENSLNKLEEKINYILTDENDVTEVTEIRRIKGLFWERLELANFPIDIQQLSITLTSYLTSSEIKFVEGTFHMNPEAVSTFIEQQKWKLYRFLHVTSHASYDIGKPHLVAKLERMHKGPKLSIRSYVKRRPAYYYWNAYLLIFLITLMALNTFAVDLERTQNRLQLTSTILLTSVSFKWIINRSIPTINYLTSLDKYSITCIVFLCSMGICHALLSRADMDIRILLDRYMFMFFCFTYLIINLTLILYLLKRHRFTKKFDKMDREFLTKEALEAQMEISIEDEHFEA